MVVCLMAVKKWHPTTPAIAKNIRTPLVHSSASLGPKLVPENAHGQIDHPYAFTSISFGAVASAPNNAKCRMVVCGHGCLETMLAHPQLHNFYFYELAKEAMRSSLFRGSVVQSVIWCADGKAVGLV
jgi:hypothetical protein